MSNFKKPIGIISKILFTLMLALTLLNVTSCDNMIESGGDVTGTESGPGQGPQGGNDYDWRQDPWIVDPKNHYSEYDNFNPTDYPIINESGKSDSELAELKDWIWLMYAEREEFGEWTANYVKKNKIKTILKDGNYIDTETLDRFYVSTYELSVFLEANNNKDEGYNYDDYTKANIRKGMFDTFTHEVMHIVQWKSSDWISLMTGMRPDICAAARLMTEFLAWFYTTHRYDGVYVYADTKNAVETQSKYMKIETDLLVYNNHPKEAQEHYDNMRSKDPSLPPFIIGSSWWFDTYAQAAISTGEVWESAMTPPLIKASKDDMLKIARALLACRDPKMAGVTDEALWTVFEFLRKSIENGEHFIINDNGSPLSVMRESFNNFQELIATWDAEYAAQGTRTVSTTSLVTQR